jgi:DNA-binding response OmpR family regulator
VRVLLVDDDVDSLDVTAYALRRSGHEVVLATDGLQALQRWKAEQPEVVVLDVGLPRMNGFDVCRSIREGSATPVILLTARNDEEQMLKGFRAGADDYITKPFSPRVLEARIQAVWARVSGNPKSELRRELVIGSIVIDCDSHEAYVESQTVRLTPIEYRLLHVLALNSGRGVSNERLVDAAWGFGAGDISLLKTHISHIRKKLKLGAQADADISSIPGVGYRLTAPQRV